VNSLLLTFAGGKNMKNKVLISLCHAIRLSPSITEYSLSSLKIDAVAARIVADSFANHYQLETLIISGARLLHVVASFCFS
jgi:hypothetical protein